MSLQPYPRFDKVLCTGQGLSAASTLVLTVTGVHLQGRVLVLEFAWANTARTVVSIVDSQSNTWTLIRSETNTGSYNARYVSSGGNELAIGDTITVTFSGTTASIGVLSCYIGMKYTESAGATATGSSTAPSVTVVRTLTNSMCLASVSHNAAVDFGAVTEATGWTTLFELHHTLADLHFHVGHLANTASGNKTYAPTLADSETWATTISDFGAATTLVLNDPLPLPGESGYHSGQGLMPLMGQLTDNGGRCPPLHSYVFGTGSGGGAATIDVVVYDCDGYTVAESAITLSATPKTMYELLVAAGIDWSEDISGGGFAIIQNATNIVCWNTSGTLDADIANPGSLVAAVGVAPSLTLSRLIATGNYKSSPYLGGRVYH